MFRRDGCLAVLGEELGVTDLLAVERRQHPGADTNKFCLCCADTPRRRRSSSFSLSVPKKDLRRVDKEEVLVVRADVGCLVGEDVLGCRCASSSEQASTGQTPSRSRGARCPACSLRNRTPDTALAQLLVDDVRDDREVLHVTRRLYSSMVKFR